MNPTEDLNSIKNELVDNIIKKIGNPVDTNAVLVAMEMIGITNYIAYEKYKAQNLEELANEIYRKAKVITLKKEKITYKEKYPILKIAKRFLSSVSQGTELAIPMVIQMLSIGLIGISLWAYIGFTPTIATFIAIGTFSSYIVTGGFVQSIGRKGLQYLSWENPVLAKRGIYKIYKRAMTLVLIIGVAIGILAFIIKARDLPYTYPIYTLFYYFLLSFLWLNLSVLYVVRKIFATIVSTTVPIFIIFIVFKLGIFNIIVSQIIGLFFACLISFIWGYFFFYDLTPEKERLLQNTKLPTDAWFIESVNKYFLFGILYFTFLIIDRIVNWTSSFKRNGMLFNSDYEIGLDFALICFPFFLIAIEYASRELFSRLVITQKNLISTEIDKYSTKFYRYYIVTLLIIPILAIFGYFILKPFLFYLYSVKNVGIIGPIFENRISSFVFNIGYVGYSFVGMGLFNSLLLISHSRPVNPIKSIIVSIFVNLLSGVILSFILYTEYSVFGLLIGGIVFFALTTYSAIKLFLEFDYASFSK